MTFRPKYVTSTLALTHSHNPLHCHTHICPPPSPPPPPATQLLHAASVLLSLHSPATTAYLSNGTAIVDTDQLSEGAAEVWVASDGEAFVSPDSEYTHNTLKYHDCVSNHHTTLSQYR